MNTHIGGYPIYTTDGRKSELIISKNTLCLLNVQWFEGVLKQSMPYENVLFVWEAMM